MIEAAPCKSEGNVLQPIFDIRAGEWAKVLPMSLFFFSVIATFWALKPMKRGLFIDYYKQNPFDHFGWHLGGAQTEQLAKITNVAAAYALAVFVTWLVRNFSRQQIISIFCTLFGLGFLAFSVLLDQPSAPVIWTFYVFGDMFNTVMVMLFWAFLSDIVTTGEAKRLYGVIGLGGVAGGLFGAFFVATTVKTMGRDTILLACLVPMILISLIVWWVNRQVEIDHPSVIGVPAHPECSSFDEGIKLLLESKYLLSIAGMVILYELVSSIIDFQLSVTVEAMVPGSMEKTAYFSQVAVIQGMVSVVAQLVVTSYVMRKFGVGTALLILPMAIFLGSAGYLIFANLLFVTVLSVSDNSLSYSVNQSARELLYVPTSRCTKYKAKAIIDMSIQRFSKVLAVVVNLGASWYLSLENVRWLSLVCLAVVMAWFFLIRYTEHSFQHMTAETKPIFDRSPHSRTGRSRSSLLIPRNQRYEGE